MKKKLAMPWQPIMIVPMAKTEKQDPNVNSNPRQEESSNQNAEGNGLFIPIWDWDKPIDRRGQLVRLYCSEKRPLHAFFVSPNEKAFRVGIARMAEELFTHEQYGEEGAEFAVVQERLVACGIGNASAFRQYLFGNPGDNFKPGHFKPAGNEIEASMPATGDSIFGI